MRSTEIMIPIRLDIGKSQSKSISKAIESLPRDMDVMPSMHSRIPRYHEVMINKSDAKNVTMGTVLLRPIFLCATSSPHFHDIA